MPSQPKKMLIIAVLETLRKYTDENHRLLQAPLLKLLEKDYGLTVDRKSLRHNIESLVNAGYPLYYRRGWYYRHEMTRADVELLAESAVLNEAISPEKCCKLVEKLSMLCPSCQPCLLAEKTAQTLSQKLYLLKKAVAHKQDVLFEAEGARRVTPLSVALQQQEWLLTARRQGEPSVSTYQISGLTGLCLAEDAPGASD